MKSWMIPLICIIALVVIGFGSFPIGPKRKTPAELERMATEELDKKMTQLRTEARSKLLVECTNAVVGLNRIVRIDMNDAGSDPEKWRADSTLEFTNDTGAVTRTNLPFVFWTMGTGSGRIIACRLDDASIFQRKLQAAR